MEKKGPLQRKKQQAHKPVQVELRRLLEVHPVEPIYHNKQREERERVGK